TIELIVTRQRVIQVAHIAQQRFRSLSVTDAENPVHSRSHPVHTSPHAANPATRSLATDIDDIRFSEFGQLLTSRLNRLPQLLRRLIRSRSKSASHRRRQPRLAESRIHHVLPQSIGPGLRTAIW